MSEKFKENVLKYCFANCFEFASIVNIVLVYLGIGLVAENVRHYLFVASLIMFFGIACWAFFKSFKIKDLSRGTLVLYLLFLGYYIMGFVIHLIRFGLTDVFKDCFPKTVIISGACFLIGYVGAKKELGKDFLTWLEKGSIVVLPVAAYYAFVHWFNCMNMKWEYGSYIGALSYMELAYLFMLYMLAHMLAFLFEGERNIVVFKRTIHYSQSVRIALVFVYWIAILASGTRGTYVACICVMFASFIVKLFDKNGRTKVFLPIAMFVFMLGLALIWRPQGMSRMSRWDIVIEKAEKGEFRTSDIDNFQSDEEMESYISSLENRITEDNDDIGSSDCENKNTNNGSDDLNSNNSDTNNIGAAVELDRPGLFKLAIYEFKNSPIIGIGPIGFYNKYGIYTHNCILEGLSDTGIIGMTIYLGVIICILFIWIFRRRKSMCDIEMLLLLIAYMVEFNISGSIWRSTGAVYWAVGYGAMIIYSIASRRRVLDGD